MVKPRVNAEARQAPMSELPTWLRSRTLLRVPLNALVLRVFFGEVFRHSIAARVAT
jgi:hypothetical protein